MNTLIGGKEINIGGEKVFVRQLPIKDYHKLLACIDDEPKIAELVCDKPQGWGESLAIDQLENVITTSDELNADFFYRWVKRRLARNERIMPGLTDKMIEASASKDSSQNSPSSVDTRSHKPASAPFRS